jgi:hypothetical protein
MRMPLSFAWFALTGFVYLLQLIPWTGVFLMLFAAPFWSVLTVNAGFVSLGVEALTGRIARLWLVAPLAWFGGYVAVSALNHRDFHQLAQAVARQNEGKTLPFSAASADLVIDSSHMSGAAGSLVRLYDLPAAYETNRHIKTASHHAHRLAGSEICRRIREEPPSAPPGFTASASTRAGSS